MTFIAIAGDEVGVPFHMIMVGRRRADLIIDALYKIGVAAVTDIPAAKKRVVCSAGLGRAGIIELNALSRVEHRDEIMENFNTERLVCVWPDVLNATVSDVVVSPEQPCERSEVRLFDKDIFSIVDLAVQ